MSASPPSPDVLQDVARRADRATAWFGRLSMVLIALYVLWGVLLGNLWFLVWAVGILLLSFDIGVKPAFGRALFQGVLADRSEVGKRVARHVALHVIILLVFAGVGCFSALVAASHPPPGFSRWTLAGVCLAVAGVDSVAFLRPVWALRTALQSVAAAERSARKALAARPRDSSQPAS